MEIECEIKISFEIHVFENWDATRFQARAIEDEIVEKCGGAAFVKVQCCGGDFTATFECCDSDEVEIAAQSLGKFAALAKNYEENPHCAIRELENLHCLDWWMSYESVAGADTEYLLRKLQEFPRTALYGYLFDPKPDQATFLNDYAQMEDKIETAFAEHFGWSLRGTAIPYWQPSNHAATQVDVATVRDYLFYEFIECKLSESYSGFLSCHPMEHEIIDEKKRLAAAVAVLVRTNP